MFTMKPMFLVVALPLMASGCASTLPQVISSTGNPDTVSDVTLVRYQGTIGSYTARMPVDPKPWRNQNDAQAPKGDAS